MQYSACERMFALFFKRQRSADELFLAHAGRRDHIRNARLAGGYRSRFVKCNDGDPSGLLKRGCGFKENAVFCTETAAHHYCHGSRKPQCARAAYNEHGYSACKRISDRVTEKQPYYGRYRCYGHYRRNEYS